MRRFWLAKVALLISMTVLAILILGVVPQKVGLSVAIPTLLLNIGVVAYLIFAPVSVPLDPVKEELIRRNMELQTKLDLLACEREVSLILNQDVDSQTVLEKVLDITAQLFGQGREIIEIYVKEPDSDRLILRAKRIYGEYTFNGRGKPQAGTELIQATLKQRQLFWDVQGDRLNMIVPLSADRELVGVMRISTELEEGRRQREERVQILSQHVEEFAKFVALAIKTPDLYTRAVEDSLTKLATKRHFSHQLLLYYDSAKRYHEPLCLLMIDIDHFKKINDTYGHLAGDKILKRIADILRKNIRRVDAAYSGYRYGGEELSVILPKTDISKGLKVAERLRRSISGHRFLIDKREYIQVTISAGIAELDHTRDTLEDLVAKADQALYQAKQGGRNMVCTWRGGC
jgi:diguanylate cyclase (GGDEF)-like protein